MLWFDGVLRSYGVFVDSRRAVPSCRRAARTSGAVRHRVREPGPAVLAELGAWNAPEPRSAWEPAARRSHTRQFQQKQPAVRPRRSKGFGKRFGASEALSSGAVRAVSLPNHRDRLRTAGAPREGPRPRQQADIKAVTASN